MLGESPSFLFLAITNDLMKLSGDERARKEADKEGYFYRRKEILANDGIRSQ